MKPQIHILTALMILFTIIANAQSAFDINDPRNPNCPCHQHQKLADEEFRQIQASGANNRMENAIIVQPSVLPSGNTVSSEKIQNKNNWLRIVVKSRNARHQLRKRWQCSVVYSCFRKLKRSVRTDLCYHWS